MFSFETYNFTGNADFVKHISNLNSDSCHSILKVLKNYMVGFTVLCCAVFSETGKLRTKVIKNNKGDFFDLTTINQANFFFVEWLFIVYPLLKRQIPSDPFHFAQAWPCHLSRHLIVMHGDIYVALMLQVSRPGKGARNGSIY